MDIAERAARDINLILTLDEKCKQQAEEIERLQSINDDVMKINARLRDEMQRLQKRVKELEEGINLAWDALEIEDIAQAQDCLTEAMLKGNPNE